MDDHMENYIENFPQLRPYCRFLYGHDGYIAGGAFKSIFTGQKVKDIDMFFPDEAAFNKAITTEFEESDDYEKYYETNKVVAYRDKKTRITIELVRSTFGNAQDVMDSFDFSITKFAMYKVTEAPEESTDPFEVALEPVAPVVRYKCAYHPKYFEHLMQHRLVLDNKVPFPVSTFERMIRYIKYGYTPCKDTKQRLLEEINKLTNITDISASLYDGLD